MSRDITISTKTPINARTLGEIERLYRDGYRGTEIHGMINETLPPEQQLQLRSVHRHIVKIKKKLKDMQQEKKEIMKASFQEAAFISAEAQIEAINIMQEQTVKLTTAAYNEGDIVKHGKGVETYARLLTLQQKLADPDSDNLKTSTIIFNQLGTTSVDQLMKTFAQDHQMLSAAVQTVEDLISKPERDDEIE